MNQSCMIEGKLQVAYSQSVSLERSCYEELSTCDIVICIIGNKFGTQSSESNYSITMEELKSAVKSKKKVYIYIARDVYIENRTYLANIGDSFIPVYADDIRIHKFIADIKESIKNHPIEAFDTIPNIIESLKKQFAGLFQHLLVQESTMTESKTYYDMAELVDQIKTSADSFKDEKESFFERFDNTVFSYNPLLNRIFSKIGLDKTVIFVRTRDELNEILQLFGYEIDIELSMVSDKTIFTKFNENEGMKLTLQISDKAFEEDGKIKKIRSAKQIDELIEFHEEEEALPF
ncbi:MAG: hypothetical protein H6Q60_820 [Oscillospiraceae bacterium]|nr:hypothetical protein [Oscillospiraceae bacterium]